MYVCRENIEYFPKMRVMLVDWGSNFCISSKIINWLVNSIMTFLMLANPILVGDILLITNQFPDLTNCVCVREVSCEKRDLIANTVSGWI